MDQSGLLAVLTAFTAIIALYRLRHRPDRTRPAVREDFNNHDDDLPTDFGLRNFGPGPALYLQVAATVEQDGDMEYAASLPVHEYPIHLREGEFASIVLGVEEEWLDRMAREYNIDPQDCENGTNPENPPKVNLYFTYVSTSGAREPLNISTERDDENLLEEIKDPEATARNIDLPRLVEKCSDT